MTAFDPRWFTSIALLCMGGLLLWVTYRLWAVDPINRVFRIGAFVTAEGMKAVVRMRLFTLAWGAFLATQGVGGVVFWFFAAGDVYAPLVTFIGSLASGFSLLAAFATGRVGYWLWRGR